MTDCSIRVHDLNRPEVRSDPEKEVRPMSALRLALLAWLALAPAARAQVLYTVTEIPGLPIAGADSSEVVAINSRGQVAGYTRTTDSTVIARAFRWSPTTGLLNLGTLPGAGASLAAGI